jgi:hypothetical protein
MSMAGTFGQRISSESVGNSVFSELTRDFRATQRAAKRVLGDQHVLTTMCTHAAQFPSDRMSSRMVWDQFAALPLAQRTELLQALRSFVH